MFKFPYTNFHELNLDWIIEKIKMIKTAVTDTAASASSAKTSETNAAASQTAAAASQTAAAESAASAEHYYNTITENVGTLVTGWLDEHVTPTSPVVDSSLSISGAAADAKVTGDGLTDLKNATTKIETDLTRKGFMSNDITWEQGAIGLHGDDVSDNRIRCNYLRFFAETVTITPNTGYWFTITEYSDDKQTIISQSSSWIQSATTITADPTHWYRFVVRYDNNYNILPSVGTQLVIEYTDILKETVEKSNLYDYIHAPEVTPIITDLDTAFGSATLNGNTITVTGQNGGALTRRFTSVSEHVRINLSFTKTVPTAAVQLVYTTANGDVYTRLKTITENSFSGSVLFDPSYYASLGALSYRILINSVDSATTGTIAISEIEVTEISGYQTSELYDPAFTQMAKNIFDAIGYGNRVFEVGTGKEYTNIFTALTDAMVYENSFVYVSAGEYDLIQQYKEFYGDASYFENYSYSHSGMGGIFLKNNVHLIFDANNTVSMNYTGSNTDVQNYFSAFNAGKKGFTIENMNLETTNIRYAIHDEMNGSETPNHNVYKNCRIKHDSSGTTWGAHQCIGGGFGASSTIEIEGCYFNSVGANHAVSYHNSNKVGATNYKSKIEMHGCYFENGSFYIGNFGNGTKISEAYVFNCSFKNIVPSYYYNSANGSDNGKLIAWNNEIRTE